MQRETAEFVRQLSQDPSNIESLKQILKVISDVKNSSMGMKFRIHEVEEQFRLMQMYNFPVDEELQAQVNDIGPNWESLLYQAKKKDFEMNDFKMSFAEVTKKQVAEFKSNFDEYFSNYEANGPGAPHVSLEQGAELLNRAKEQAKFSNQKREELVLAEKLFNLPISKFDQLIKMESLNQLFDSIYGIFARHQAQVREWSMMPWSKLDLNALMTGAEGFDKEVRRLTSKVPQVDGLKPYEKLRETVSGFKNSLPLIEQLKIPAVQERHWKKIMEETGKDLGEISLKTITLAKVFELELQNHEEVVTAICTEAREEAKNEENLTKIEAAWKSQNFEVIPVKNGYKLRPPEDVKTLLED